MIFTIGSIVAVFGLLVLSPLDPYRGMGVFAVGVVMVLVGLYTYGKPAAATCRICTETFSKLWKGIDHTKYTGHPVVKSCGQGLQPTVFVKTEGQSPPSH